MPRRIAPYGFSFGAGALAGSLATDTEVAKSVIDAYVRILDRQGFAAAIASLLLVFLIVGFSITLRVVTTTKDTEIERLTSERDRLLEPHLRKPGTTAPEQPT